MSEYTEGREAEALVLATEAHRGQEHGWEILTPYIEHPERVAEALRALGAPSVVIIAAYLHDIVEDTTVTLDEVEHRFGLRVREITDAMTRRKEAGEDHWTYLERLMHDPLATMVKLADSRDNQAHLPEGHSLHKKYNKTLAILTGRRAKPEIEEIKLT